MKKREDKKGHKGQSKKESQKGQVVRQCSDGV